MLLLSLGRDLFLGGDEPIGDLTDLAGLVDVLSLCLGGELELVIVLLLKLVCAGRDKVAEIERERKI